MSSNQKLTLSDFVIRPALKSDYSDIMDISHDIYGGRDIIPAVYFEYLDDPNRVFYVAVNKQSRKVASFAGARIVDNGETYEGEGARTDSKLRGTGLGLHGAVRTALLRHVLPRFPGVKRFRVVTVGVKEMRKQPEFYIIPFGMRSVRDIIWNIPKWSFLQNMCRLRGSISQDHLCLDRITRGDTEDIKHIFKHPSLHHNLFPSGVIVRDSQSFTMGVDYLSNVPLLLGDRLHAIYLTRSVDSPNHIITSISFGTGIESNVSLKGMRYCIDYYGNPDIDVIKGHVLKHLQEMPPCLSTSSTAEVVSSYIFVPNEVSAKVDLEHIVTFVGRDLEFGATPSEHIEQCVADCRLSPHDLVLSTSKL